MQFTLQQLQQALGRTEVNSRESSYLQTYRHVLSYFRSLRRIDPAKFVVGAQIVYGWMPTMLKLREPNGGYRQFVQRLNEVRNGHEISEADLQAMKYVINNSLVGSSKFLHCLMPKMYPIWDSRVYRFIHNTVTQYQLSKPTNYLDYLRNCREVSQHSAFSRFHQRVNQKVGYPVSKFRAMEWVMYMNGV